MANRASRMAGMPDAKAPIFTSSITVLQMADARFHVHKLASAENPWGVSCNAQGVSVGPVPLLERTHGNAWRPRSVAALSADLSRYYDIPVDLGSKVEGIATVASALNENNLVKAKIAAVHLRLPDIPPHPIPRRRSAEVVELALQLFGTGILSKTWDPEKHPRWPSGESDGGRFRPADGTSAGQEDRPASSKEIAADPAKFTECNERCSKLLEKVQNLSLERRQRIPLPPVHERVSRNWLIGGHFESRVS
jgi:hypothetical protein